IIPCVKQMKKLGEDAKVAARNNRRDAMEALKKMKTAKEISEDESRNLEQDVEKSVGKAMEEIDKAIAAKEKELLTV
ncbi:MAG: ribosome recycling factor, partial [Clostridia bacterium]|nr:ribosome recycling factor [Clostridia bacterium]